MKFLYLLDYEHAEMNLNIVFNLFTEHVDIEHSGTKSVTVEHLETYDCLILRVGHTILDTWEQEFDSTYLKNLNWFLLFDEDDEELIKRAMNFFGIQHLFYIKQPFDQFNLAMREILKGNLYLDPHLVKRHFKKYEDYSLPQETTTSLFTARQLQVLALLLKGYNQVEISQQLFLTKQRVSEHLKSMRQKANVKTNMELAAKAVLKGWIHGEDIEHLLV